MNCVEQPDDWRVRLWRAVLENYAIYDQTDFFYLTRLLLLSLRRPQLLAVNGSPVLPSGKWPASAMAVWLSRRADAEQPQCAAAGDAFLKTYTGYKQKLSIPRSTSI